MHTRGHLCLFLLISSLLSACGGLHTYRTEPQSLKEGDVAVEIHAQLDRAFVRTYLHMSTSDSAVNALNTLLLVPDFHTSLKLKGFSSDRSLKQESDNQNTHKKMIPKARSKTHQQNYDWSQSIYWGNNSFWFIAKATSEVSIFLITSGTRNTHKGLVTLPISDKAVQRFNIVMNGETLSVNGQVLLPAQ